MRKSLERYSKKHIQNMSQIPNKTLPLCLSYFLNEKKIKRNHNKSRLQFGIPGPIWTYPEANKLLFWRKKYARRGDSNVTCQQSRTRSQNITLHVCDFGEIHIFHFARSLVQGVVLLPCHWVYCTATVTPSGSATIGVLMAISGNNAGADTHLKQALSLDPAQPHATAAGLSDPQDARVATNARPRQHEFVRFSGTNS